MFDELFNAASQQISKFSDTVQDRFGQSIVSDVFEPFLQDIFSFQQIGEGFHNRINEITQLTGELQLVKTMRDE